MPVPCAADIVRWHGLDSGYDLSLPLGPVVGKEEPKQAYRRMQVTQPKLGILNTPSDPFAASSSASIADFANFLHARQLLVSPLTGLERKR